MKSLLLALTLFTMTEQGYKEADQIPEDYKISFALPINWTQENKLNLLVSIPEGFRSLQSLTTDADQPLFEFIPKDESEDDWSEIITINKLIGEKVPAIDLTAYVKKTMLDQIENGKVWKEENKENDDYQNTILGLTYTLNGQKEVMGAEYFSGPYDCVGVQYTIRPKDKSVDQAQDKISQFFKDHLSLLSAKNEE